MFVPPEMSDEELRAYWKKYYPAYKDQLDADQAELKRLEKRNSRLRYNWKIDKRRFKKIVSNLIKYNFINHWIEPYPGRIIYNWRNRQHKKAELYYLCELLWKHGIVYIPPGKDGKVSSIAWTICASTFYINKRFILDIRKFGELPLPGRIKQQMESLIPS